MNLIRDHFSKKISDYDTLSDKVVMKNDELHNKIISLIPSDVNSPIIICDLGCGTGHGMKLAFKKFKNCKGIGIDFSPKMILKSNQNLKEFQNKELICADFTTFNFPKEEYDVVISAIAIHNISHEKKEKLFLNIYNSLKKGGIFINADFFLGETKEIDDKYKEIYKNYLMKNLAGKELKIWIKHAFNEDLPMKLSEQFKLLKNCNFSRIDKFWEFNNEAIYLAVK